VLQRVTPLLRAAKNLTGVLQQAREAEPADRNILLARDEAVEIERHLDLLHSEALHGLQFMVASRAEQQAKQGEQLVQSSHRLNLLVALCLPATAFASVLGMNVRHGLENQETWVFWVVLSVAILMGIVILAMVAAPTKTRGKG
jgi:Mg2+ and Co2+ transporter CorA